MSQAETSLETMYPRISRLDDSRTPNSGSTAVNFESFRMPMKSLGPVHRVSVPLKKSSGRSEK